MKSVPRSFRFSWIHLWIFQLLLLLPAPASSQQFAANEFTVGATLQTFGWIDCEAIGNGPACNPVTVHSVYVPIPSFTYTRNLSRSVALEGTIQPTSDFVRTDGFDSGHEALALGGIKSGWRGQRWGLYGKFQAGVASFSCAVSSYSGNTTSGYTENCSRLTDFAMEYGGVVEYHKTPRYAFRLDAGLWRLRNSIRFSRGIQTEPSCNTGQAAFCSMPICASVLRAVLDTSKLQLRIALLPDRTGMRESPSRCNLAFSPIFNS